MDQLVAAWHYVLQNWGDFVPKLITQVELSASALAIALVICLPLGIIAARNRLISIGVINLFGTARVIPSIAVLFLAYPILGFGFTPALVALTVLACPPILVNTSAGYSGVEAAVVEAARGMGMSGAQVLRRIETPLALPVVLAGVRTAAIEVVASSTLATFIGGGGLGDYITQGFSTNNTVVTLAGAVPVALLAICTELLFGGVQGFFSRAM